jgi:DNA-binding response OmpR family regulator
VNVKTVRVLVVDDYKSIANALCRALRTRGHDARAVHSGAAAVNESAAFEPQLVLLDIELPDTTGYAVAKALRRHASAPMYIVAISSRPILVDENIDDRASKPFGLERLDEILEVAAKRTS